MDRKKKKTTSCERKKGRVSAWNVLADETETVKEQRERRGTALNRKGSLLVDADHGSASGGGRWRPRTASPVLRW